MSGNTVHSFPPHFSRKTFWPLGRRDGQYFLSARFLSRGVFDFDLFSVKGSIGLCFVSADSIAET